MSIPTYDFVARNKALHSACAFVEAVESVEPGGHIYIHPSGRVGEPVTLVRIFSATYRFQSKRTPKGGHKQ